MPEGPERVILSAADFGGGGSFGLAFTAAEWPSIAELLALLAFFGIAAFCTCQAIVLPQDLLLARPQRQGVVKALRR